MAGESYKDGLLGEFVSQEGLDFMPLNFQGVDQLGSTGHALEYLSELS